MKAGKGGRPENHKQVRWKLQSDRLLRGWKDQPAHGTNKGRGRSQLAQMDDLLARTRCFKCGELGHLVKDCHQNKESTTESETFFSGMVGVHQLLHVHPRNRFWADRCRDNSCAGPVRSNCTGFSQDDPLVFLEVILLVFLEVTVLAFLETNPVLTMTLETNPLCNLILETVGVLKLTFNKMMELFSMFVRMV